MATTMTAPTAAELDVIARIVIPSYIIQINKGKAPIHMVKMADVVGVTQETWTGDTGNIYRDTNIVMHDRVVTITEGMNNEYRGVVTSTRKQLWRVFDTVCTNVLNSGIRIY